jgi:hypothetical protein
VPGWARIDELLRIQEDGYPLLQVYDTCRDLIRTLPAMPRDKKNPEDVDTTTEDHLADALRYGAMFLAGRTAEDRAAAVKRSPLAPPATAVLGRSGF